MKDGKKTSTTSLEDWKPFDMIIDERFVEYSCKCEDCSPLYTKIAKIIKASDNLNEEDKKLHNNLDGNLNEDEEMKESGLPESNSSNLKSLQLLTQPNYVYQILQ